MTPTQHEQRSTQQPNDKTHYIIETSAIEWMYTMTKMIQRYKKDKVPDDNVMLGFEGNNTIYYIKKALIPVEEIARVTGTEPDAVRAAKRIKLKALKPTWQRDETVPAVSIPGLIGEA